MLRIFGKVIVVTRELRKVVTPGRLKITTALLKFCRDHDSSPFVIERLAECLAALHERRYDRVEELVNVLGHAGMGSFLDWVPPVTFAHENPDYVGAVWNALVGQWLEQLRPFRKHDT